MHYVTVEGLSKSFGINPLFNNISFHLSEGDKISLVARNGVGKSTLLKILAGQETADSGTVWINKDVTVALFEQDPKFDESKTILENIFHTDTPVLRAIRDYEAAIDEGEDADPETFNADENGQRIADALEKMDEFDAWSFESKVKEILAKLNIHHLQQPVANLSGGQRKRVALAQTLIDIGFEHQHTLLFMDEPTNHLDVEMIEWLEHYLNGEHVTLLLVTHDRYFLDAVSDEIWEMERSELYTYKGDYANYLEKKAARIESELATIDKAKNTFRKELEWMRKQPKARTTKSKSRQDNFYEIEAVAKKKIEDAQLQLEVKMTRLGGNFTMMLMVHYAGDVATLEQLVAPVSESLGLKLHVDQIEGQLHRHPEADVHITVCGADRAGIVAQVTTVLAEAGLDILDLQSDVAGTEDKPIYIMQIEGRALQGVAALESAVQILDGKGMDVHLEPIDLMLG